MDQVHSFEPVIGQRPTVIILGSMPGVVSLQANQYYANPRNAFWKIMGELFSLQASASYAQRIEQISSKPVILWDSLKACHRPGSLDAKIQPASAEANDFSALLLEYSEVRAIVFNGAASEKFFRRLALPTLTNFPQLQLLSMPSTSPANAGMSFAQKLARWQALLDYID